MRLLALKDLNETVKRHNELDDEITRLEELGQPVSDETLEKMKYERARLNDAVYFRIRSGS